MYTKNWLVRGPTYFLGGGGGGEGSIQKEEKFVEKLFSIHQSIGKANSNLSQSARSLQDVGLSSRESANKAPIEEERDTVKK